MPSNEALLDEHLAAENDHDLDRIMATYGESPVVVLNGQRIEGKAGIREFHRSFGFGDEGSFGDLHVEERHRHKLPDVIILEQTLTGRHAGQWMGIEASGRTFKVDVCTVYEFDAAGRLACERVYFDLRWIERQLWS
jgi:steroid delta-isomerase-like uncharacterized protein